MSYSLTNAVIVAQASPAPAAAPQAAGGVSQALSSGADTAAAAASPKTGCAAYKIGFCSR